MQDDVDKLNIDTSEENEKSVEQKPVEVPKPEESQPSKEKPKTPSQSDEVSIFTTLLYYCMIDNITLHFSTRRISN